MGKIYNSVTELIGGTPLLKANNFIKANGLKANIFVKLEYFNPAGSVKDRIAKAMIEQAEKDGKFKPGATIIEPTSGNTGIGLDAQLGSDVLLGEDEQARRFLAMLEERLDGCAVDEELQREHVVDEHLEAAHTAAAILHARAVDRHDLRRAVVREDRLLEAVGQRHRDLLCLA